MDALAAADIALVRADNPGPFTLEGSNSWLVARDPCWIVDPGPDLPAHVDALVAEAERRGGVGGIALTHGHADHSAAVGSLVARTGEVPVAAMAWPGATIELSGGERCGPFEVIPTPGHTPDHVAFLAGHVLFTGDAVLGRGSVFVYPDPGALRGYLQALDGLIARDLEPDLPRPRAGRHRAAREARAVRRPPPRS